jgi:hypothetical protein
MAYHVAEGADLGLGSVSGTMAVTYDMWSMISPQIFAVGNFGVMTSSSSMAVV